MNNITSATEYAQNNSDALRDCRTKVEAQEWLDDMNADPKVIIVKQRKIQRANRKDFEARCREIRAVELEPTHDECKRWKHGQKVYFGKGDNLTRMYFEPRAEFVKEYDIKPGDWCYVWQYQKRKKYAWLCQPGKACEWDNIINHSFSLDELERKQVSRTEPAIR